MLVLAVANALSFRPVKAGHSSKPHPLRLHIEKLYGTTTIHEKLTGVVHKCVDKFFFESKMLLFGLCASFSGFATNYRFDHNAVVGNAWGGITSNTVRALNEKTLRAFFDRCNVQKCNNVKTNVLLKAILAGLTFRPILNESKVQVHPLRQHLEQEYKSLTIQSLLYNGKEETSSKWSNGTKLFLFGLAAMFGGAPQAYRFDH